MHMNLKNELVSKVLVCDTSEKAASDLREYFCTKGLQGLCSQTGNILNLLEMNTDLGGVFLYDAVTVDNMTGLELAHFIHDKRPELPIFLRTDSTSLCINEKDRSCISAIYSLDDFQVLDKAVDEHLFSMYYPIPLIRGIQEISQEAFSTVMTDVEVSCETPYLVKDQFIYGELLSLIPLESHWCRGFMMLQTTQLSIMDLIKNGKTALDHSNPGFRDVNELLNEITNLIWGKIKAKFLVDQAGEQPDYNRIQVPIMVNHLERYISFGSTEPQLCFRYTIRNMKDIPTPIEIYQKMVFNLSWKPEGFEQCETETNDLVDCGELEFF